MRFAQVLKLKFTVSHSQTKKIVNITSSSCKNKTSSLFPADEQLCSFPFIVTWKVQTKVAAGLLVQFKGWSWSAKRALGGHRPLQGQPHPGWTGCLRWQCWVVWRRITVQSWTRPHWWNCSCSWQQEECSALLSAVYWQTLQC